MEKGRREEEERKIDWEGKEGRGGGREEERKERR